MTPQEVITEPEAAEAIVTEREGVGPVVVRTMPWYAILLVRATRAMLTAVSGVLSSGPVADVVGVSIPHLTDSTKWKLAGSVAIGTFITSLLLNGAELLTKLDQTNPQMRA